MAAFKSSSLLPFYFIICSCICPPPCSGELEAVEGPFSVVQSATTEGMLTLACLGTVRFVGVYTVTVHAYRIFYINKKFEQKSQRVGLLFATLSGTQSSASAVTISSVIHNIKVRLKASWQMQHPDGK